MKFHAAAVLTLMVLPSRGERKSSFEVRVSGKYSSLGHDSLMTERASGFPTTVFGQGFHALDIKFGRFYPQLFWTDSQFPRPLVHPMRFLVRFFCDAHNVP